MGVPDQNPPIRPASGEPAGAAAARELARIIAAARIAIGAGLALAPELSMRLLGFDRASDQTILVSRLAGGRDAVIGALTLLAAGDGERLAQVSLAGAAVDAGDAAAFAAALRRSPEMRPAALRGLAAALPATLAGVWIASRLRRPGVRLDN